jgi:hypothetical protein
LAQKGKRKRQRDDHPPEDGRHANCIRLAARG